jgi:DNA-binding response OmpR family regulator
MRVILVEDDEKIAAFIVKGFEQGGLLVDHIDNAEEGLYLITTRSYDAAIVDIMLPGMDGLSLIDEMRRTGIQTPVLILSAKRSVDDRVKGLQAGGDDYLTKPFAFSELFARVQALVRRFSKAKEPMTLTVGDLHIDLLKHEVHRGDRRIDLQPKEFSLLELLARNHDQIVTKTMILEYVWGYNFDPQTNVVEARICRLRDKIDNESEHTLIHTMRGMGYVLKKPA